VAGELLEVDLDRLVAVAKAAFGAFVFYRVDLADDDRVSGFGTRISGVLSNVVDAQRGFEFPADGSKFVRSFARFDGKVVARIMCADARVPAARHLAQFAACVG